MINRPIREVVKRDNLVRRGVPREFTDATFGQYDFGEEYNDLLRRYLENIPLMFSDGINLLFYGPNGTGKTWISSLIVKEAYIRRYSTYRVTLQELIDMTFKNDENTEFRLHRIVTSEFLAIDEIGKEIFHKNQYNIIRLEEILRKRETLGRPTIVCTNLQIDDLTTIYGSSISSLLMGSYIQLLMDGEDNRSSALSEKRGISVLMGDD